MAKRIKCEELHRAKNQFINQLSFVIERLNNHHTQREIAAVCGVSSSIISNIKNDKKDKVSLEALMEVAKKLGLIYEVAFRSDGDSLKIRVHVESAFEYQTRIKGENMKVHHELRLH
jgi:transcriptional regulator with XRE-family HTH domain